MNDSKREKNIAEILSEIIVPKKGYGYDCYESIGPYDAGYFDRDLAARRIDEAAAQKALLGLSDEKLEYLVTMPFAASSFASKYYLGGYPTWYSGGFGVKGYQPDYDYWSKHDYWTLEEATSISVGVSPEHLKHVYNRAEPVGAQENFLIERREQIRRATCTSDAEPKTVIPAKFGKWATSKSIPIPDELFTALTLVAAKTRPKMVEIVDRREHDSALKLILGLISILKGFEADSLTEDLKVKINNEFGFIGLSLDDDTLVKVVAEATAARKRFELEQAKMDNKPDRPLRK